MSFNGSSSLVTCESTEAGRCSSLELALLHTRTCCFLTVDMHGIRSRKLDEVFHDVYGAPTTGVCRSQRRLTRSKDFTRTLKSMRLLTARTRLDVQRFDNIDPGALEDMLTIAGQAPDPMLLDCTSMLPAKPPWSSAAQVRAPYCSRLEVAV